MATAGSDRAKQETTRGDGESPVKAEANAEKAQAEKAQPEKILCPHCKRTASNGIKCLGICVADNDY